MPLRRADDILAWLLARQPDKRIVEKTTGLPYGWGLWLRALTPLPRPVRAGEIVAQLMQRPLPGPPGRTLALSTPQALRQLLWQTWEPAPRDQRWMRWTSAVISVLLHVMFAVLLVWVALIRPPVPAEQGGDGGGRMQVRFIGAGGDGDPGAAPTSAITPDAAADGVAPSGAEPASAIPSGAEPRSTSAPTASRSEAAPTRTASTPPPTPPAPETPDAPPVPQPPTPPQPAPVATTPPEPAPTPPTLAPAEPQPVQATDVAEATTDFVVPPTVVPRTEVRVVPREAPQVQVRERTVTTVEAPVVTQVAPQVRPIDVQVPQREITVREREVTVVTAPTPTVSVPGPRVEVTLPQREVQVREREVASVPDLEVRVPQMAPREISAPAPTRSPEVAVRERSIPNAAVSAPPAELPARTPAPAASSESTAPPASTASAAPSSASSTSSSAPSSTSSPAPAPARGTAAAAPSAAPAARPAPNPGDWSTPARGDDWGAASRTPGGAAQANQGSGRTGDGLFNADGSVRVPGQDGSGDAERGAPGGENDGWSRERIAQSGTWLKRPPYDYTPTSFDKYWAPNESLLAEWVRRGVQAVEIPIPGSSSKISCVISILQFGGGCGLTDPNMQDQPAVARPPPDIPFKKELQEDNGSR